MGGEEQIVSFGSPEACGEEVEHISTDQSNQTPVVGRDSNLLHKDALKAPFVDLTGK